MNQKIIQGIDKLPQILKEVNCKKLFLVVDSSFPFLSIKPQIETLGFEKIFLLQNDLNLNVSRVLSTYTYDVGMLGAQFDYSTAVSLFNTLVNLAVLLIANKIVKKLSGIGMW